ncbi:MAG: 5-formyltetrahydrofolate cyclo-ligase [Christensenella sp.]|uniref:5-formyltetrahydrofolate cyclo-ligase n=1 Tax=Christensenella sp. TaxID=1935934 RepID=UPI002B1E920A|nr:5-formyltetrahydrofolate cyclo-ligase [Christensenella sp.]MEA5003716.1 5-formyltetrahydrofolate cyclo-ligase [Christensenella sp.]
MNKQEIREKVLDMRRSLTSKYIEDESIKAIDRLLNLPELSDVKNVLVYSDFDCEVKTANLTGWLLYHGAQVFLPVVHEKKMYAANIKSAVLELSCFGVAQPKYNEAEIIEPDMLDLIIIPGVAFDRALNRVGFGGGYYDAFLKQASRAKKIALAYDFQILDQVLCEAHDVKMDMIVTPDETIS